MPKRIVTGISCFVAFFSLPLLLLSPLARTISLPFCICSRYISKCKNSDMGQNKLNLQGRKSVNFRLCNVSSYTTELLEIVAEDPKLHVLVIPGNPGFTPMYKDFVESLYELLKGSASITAVGHVSHTKKNWEDGRLFSLKEQIEHKLNFIKHELQDDKVPILLIGHSIGAYISIEVFKRIPQKVMYFIGLYPFLALNKESLTQSVIGKLAASPFLSVALSSLAALLGLLPRWASRFVLTKSVGRSWSATLVEEACTYMLQYHTVRNILFLANTEFEKLSEEPDWAFMRGKKGQIAFLFGVDDHWGPLSMYEEISKQVPDVALSIEREGHMHAFCCTEAGSLWVAQHVANLIKNNIQNSIE